MSDLVYEQLRTKPTTLRPMVLQTAGRRMKIKGTIVGPVEIEIGKRRYHEEVIVAPIADDMLLGLDFMLKYGVRLNLPEAKIEIGMEEIPLVVDQQVKTSAISRVTVQQRMVIPPNSVKLIPCVAPENNTVHDRTKHGNTCSHSKDVVFWERDNTSLRREYINTECNTEEGPEYWRGACSHPDGSGK